MSNQPETSDLVSVNRGAYVETMPAAQLEAERRLSATPQTRIRLAHDFLAKEGWRYEDTVEIEFAGDETDDAVLARLEDLKRRVGEIGAAERDRRNAQDGRS